MDKIVLTGIRSSGIHGAYDSERERSRPFEVNLTVEVDLALACETDQLSNTVDYSRLASEAARIVREGRFNLIEALASRIADVVLSDPRVVAVEVEVCKFLPEVEARLSKAAVRIRREQPV